MKLLPLLAAAGIVAARSLEYQQVFSEEQLAVQDTAETFLIEVEPGTTRWVTEDEKWELKRAGLNFMDITDNQQTFPAVDPMTTTRPKTKVPSKTSYSNTTAPLIKALSKKNMRKHLETFTAFHTRYYKSDYGIESAKWLYSQISDIIKASGADNHGAFVEQFSHPWGQFSIIARLPGRTNKTVVIGAHQDSINLFLPSILAAPGADDDGSGTVTILEALTAILKDDSIVHGNHTNTLEFHWYSAEEGGLLGSQALFKSYAESDPPCDVRAMVQQDMTGYVHKTLEAGLPESVGVITDFVDPGLTEFIKKVIDSYCDIPYVLTKCGYACSDHASATKYGYPSAFVIESDFKYSDNKIHTTEDKIQYLSFAHMLQHAKMTLGFAYEMAFADL